MRQTAKKLEAQSEQDTTQIETLKARLEELEEQLSGARRENAGLYATAEQLRQQVQSQQAELDRLHKSMEEDKKQHQAEIERLRQEREAAIKEAAELKGKAESLQAHNAELLTRLTDQKKSKS